MGSIRKQAWLKRRRRRGYVLVFWAMMLFGLMGLAALVIDIGFARLTQRQMQTAADAAALEGLRGEGSVLYSDRQERARNFANWHFDDDLDLNNDDGAFDSGSGQFGAGPLVEFSGGAGDPELGASQLMEVDPNTPVYKPTMLDGVASPAGFQVLMQRGGTLEPTTDIYSHGPAVPYLFARGSLADRQMLQEGMIVRATGKAEYARAKSVGVARPNLNLAGLAQFAFEVADGVIDYESPYFYSPALPDHSMTLGWQLPETPVATPPPGVYPASGEPPLYAPVYATLPSGLPRCVVGFVKATVVVEGEVATGAPHSDQRALENAAGTPCGKIDLSELDLNDTMALHQGLESLLLAPISGR